VRHRHASGYDRRRSEARSASMIRMVGRPSAPPTGRTLAGAGRGEVWSGSGWGSEDGRGDVLGVGGSGAGTWADQPCWARRVLAAGEAAGMRRTDGPPAGPTRRGSGRWSPAEGGGPVVGIGRASAVGPGLERLGGGCRGGSGGSGGSEDWGGCGGSRRWAVGWAGAGAWLKRRPGGGAPWPGLACRDACAAFGPPGTRAEAGRGAGNRARPAAGGCWLSGGGSTVVPTRRPRSTGGAAWAPPLRPAAPRVADGRPGWLGLAD